MAKKTWILMLALLAALPLRGQQTGLAGAEQQQHAMPQVIGSKEVVQGPTYADVYCAGFLSSQAPQEVGYVAGAWNSPHEMKYGSFDYLYLKGSGFQTGNEYQILRRMKDPNRFKQYSGQAWAVRSAGQLYGEMGRVKVLDVRENMAITQVQFACDGISPGDIAVPAADQPIPRLHGAMTFDRFAAPNGKTTGRIIMAKDFDYLLGNRSKVYLDIGADKGLKLGDFFRVTRTYDEARRDRVDFVSLKVRHMADDTQDSPKILPITQLDDMPRRSLGELVIVDVTPKSATGVVTFALEEMFVGDSVELMDVPPPPPAPVAAAATPPTIQCMASPTSIRVGDNATISCQAASPENRALSFAFATDRGSLAPRDNAATLMTRNTSPGPVTVNATVTDDRNLSASTSVQVNVEAAPAAPEPAMAGEAAFKSNGGYVDNRAKAMLDGVALRLNQERDARAVIVGFADAGEPQTLASSRAANIKTYLVQKGIDPSRIETRAGTGAGKKGEVWIIPAGANMP